MDVGIAIWGDGDYPETLSDAINWARTFNASRPIPEWVFETMELLQEGEEEAFRGDFHIRECILF